MLAINTHSDRFYCVSYLFEDANCYHKDKYS